LQTARGPSRRGARGLRTIPSGVPWSARTCEKVARRPGPAPRRTSAWASANARAPSGCVGGRRFSPSAARRAAASYSRSATIYLGGPRPSTATPAQGVRVGRPRLIPPPSLPLLARENWRRWKACRPAPEPHRPCRRGPRGPPAGTSRPPRPVSGGVPLRPSHHHRGRPAWPTSRGSSPSAVSTASPVLGRRIPRASRPLRPATRWWSTRENPIETVTRA